MADASNGGCVRSAASGSASVRPCAVSMATISAAMGATPSRMRARASSTDSGGGMESALPNLDGPVRPRSPAGLLEQPDAFDNHGFVGGFEHVVDGKAGDGDGGQSLHLHAGLPRHL